MADADLPVLPSTNVGPLLDRCPQLEIVELVNDFLPAPGIDIMRTKGLLVWSVPEEQGPVRTYVSEPGDL